MKTAMQVNRKPSNEEMARMHREFIQAIQPIIKAKCDLMNKCLPRITVYPSGKVEREYDFTEEQKRLLEDADKYIEHLKHVIFKDFVELNEVLQNG